MKKRDKFPKLFITDLDGTALGGFKPYSRFPDVFSKFLDKLDERGCRWITNTAWAAASQEDLFYASSICSRPAFICGGVSLELCTLKENELVKVQPYFSKMQKKLSEIHHSAMYGFMRDVCMSFNPVRMSFNGFWFSFTPLEDQLEDLFSYIRNKYLDNRELCIEILPEEKRIHARPAFLKKDLAIREIMEILKLTPDDIVVAGDEIMDIEMMLPDIARYAICPNNARPEVKKRVRETGGCIGDSDYGPGTIDAFNKLALKEGWDWE